MESELNKVRLLYEDQIVELNDIRAQLEEEKLKNELLDQKNQDLFTTINDHQKSLDDSSIIVMNLKNSLSNVQIENETLQSCLLKVEEENVNLINLINVSKKELSLNQQIIFNNNEEIEGLTNDIARMKREVMKKNEMEVNSNNEKLFLQNQIKERALEIRNLQTQIGNILIHFSYSFVVKFLH